MCLYRRDSKDDTKFKSKHANDDVIVVWKVYYTLYDCVVCDHTYLQSMYQGHCIFDPGVVKSDRRRKRLNKRYDRDTHAYSSNWRVYNGIHVYTDRKTACIFADHSYERVVVCCHAKMSDFVAFDKTHDEAVFMEVTISPRNYRKAVRYKRYRFTCKQ